jgi:hypothetical protein
MAPDNDFPQLGDNSMASLVRRVLKWDPSPFISIPLVVLISFGTSLVWDGRVTPYSFIIAGCCSAGLAVGALLRRRRARLADQDPQ